MPHFNGFSPDIIGFLKDIKHNNNREWFEARRPFYEAEVLETSRDFVEAMGEQLLTIAPRVHVVPKVNGSIYRFARDTRFSADKTPYKQHLSYLFWEGQLKRTRCPGFFMAITATEVRIGAGINIFEPHYLQAWRECCQHPSLGPELQAITEKLIKAGFQTNGEQLQRLPRGVPKDTLNPDFIRFKGLRFFHIHPHPANVNSADFVAHCMSYYEQLLELHLWMMKVMSYTREYSKYRF